ncbi:hypothetical protein JTB14_003581 [Gonioctena quinquepunctata]|nr:hypothetical protein JTB14_003581 [Gonioctena quinquepunctata]
MTGTFVYMVLVVFVDSLPVEKKSDIGFGLLDEYPDYQLGVRYDEYPSIDMNMQVALDALTELKKFLIKIRTDANFEEIVNDAMKIAEKLDVEAEFETKTS